jgi:hypothetical protein
MMRSSGEIDGAEVTEMVTPEEDTLALFAAATHMKLARHAVREVGSCAITDVAEVTAPGPKPPKLRPPKP